ncbi:MAG TPA: calcium/sodium antiporter [Candidatus Paceibacterota bacterium]|nr:calcium/sodium antiporter [Candidatus Paceibacterota bacterium]
MDLIFLAVGLAVLIKSANWLVDGAASIAKRLGVSSLVIGLTIVAFGTSAPELVVNLVSVVQGNTQLAIGNIVGSNIANILLILGVASIIYPLTVKSTTVWKEIPLALLASVIVMALANDALLDGAPFSTLSFIDGIVLLAFFGIFLYYTYGVSKVAAGEDGEEVKEFSTLRSVVMVVAGLAGLIIGGKLLVDAAVSIASAFGMSESLIGLTVVAIGTSLPELATSAVAAFKKQSDIAIGNVVGSNIFNTFWILGVSALIRPLPMVPANNFDFLVSIGASLLLFLALFVGRRHLLERWQGHAFIGLYAAYITILVT